MKNNTLDIDKKKSGVYKITNLVNGDFYIGSTNCLLERYRGHLSDLKRAKSNSFILQNAVIKYGLVNFEFSTIEVCDNYREREIILMEELKPKYNIVKEEQNIRVISQESRDRMSKAQKGRASWNKGKKGFKYNRIKKKAVRSTNIQTGEQIIHKSVEEARMYFSLSLTAVYQCCLNQRNSANNIKFEYWII